MRLTITRLLALSLIGLGGCGERKIDRPLAPAEGQLYKIGRAYLQRTYRVGRPPKGPEELAEDLKDAGPDVWVSPNDGEKFVILWGVDFNKLPSPPNDPFFVGGYEKQGAGGRRYVLRFPINVVQLTDGEFEKARFPPGRAPAR